MDNKKYIRKNKEDKPVLAICYDFDKTLTPDNMQEQGFIQSIGYGVEQFWNESNKLAEKNNMDQNLAYMLTMIHSSNGERNITRAELEERGKDIRLFPGVEEWFDRTKKYGAEKGVIVEHYIISSGLQEMIEGTSTSKSGAFEKVYACSFFYDENGYAIWPVQVVNYTNKTQFLFRVVKGVLDVNDPGVNEFFTPENIRVPFRNMVYIGDSDTDIPCMKLVNSKGGYSIGVYDPETCDKSKVFRMLNEGRIKYYSPADYSEGSDLDKLIKTIINRTAENELLESFHYKNASETKSYFDKLTPDENEKERLIDALKESMSFANTHNIVRKLSQYDGWTNSQSEKLFRVALKNNQVRWVLLDNDVKLFYNTVLNGYKAHCSEADEVRIIIKGR